MKKGGWKDKEVRKGFGLSMVQEGLRGYAKEAVVQHIHPSWIKNVKKVRD